MPWTALHAALGDTTPDLSFNMIERAVRGTTRPAGTCHRQQFPLTAPDTVSIAALVGRSRHE
jgi:hypothetical protein